MKPRGDELIGEVKKLAGHIDNLVSKMIHEKDIDNSWVNTANVDLRRGIMALNLAINPPDKFQHD